MGSGVHTALTHCAPLAVFSMKVARCAQPDFTWTWPHHPRLSVLSLGTQTDGARQARSSYQQTWASLPFPAPLHPTPASPLSLGEERWLRAAPCYLRAEVVSQARDNSEHTWGSQARP